MSSERRGAELLLLDSIGAFQSMLLKVMVAVRRRWLQRMTSRERGRRQECALQCGGFDRMRDWNRRICDCGS